MCRRIEFVPGVSGDAGGIERRVVGQQADQGVEIGRLGLVGVDQAAEGVDGLLVPVEHCRQLSVEPPVFDVILRFQAGLRAGAFQPGQTFRVATAYQQDDSDAQGARRGELPGLREQALPVCQGKIEVAVALGQFGQEQQGVGQGRMARVLRQALHVLDGCLRVALPLIGGDEFAHQSEIARPSRDLVVQGGNQGAVVEQAGGQPQDAVPGGFAVAGLGQRKPVFQSLLRTARPLGDLRQPFAPGLVSGRLPHGGIGHPPGVFKFAVFQENLVAQGIDIVVEGDAGAAGFGLLRRLLQAAVAPGAGHFQSAPLLQQGKFE